jgi:hypothetical protein
MKYLLIIIALFSILLTACNKEQLSVEKLEGNWKLSEKKVFLDNVDQMDSSLVGKTVTYTFQSCDLKTEEFCNANVRTVENAQQNDAPMMYRFGDDAKTLVIDNDADITSSSDRINMKVTKLTKDKFEFEYELTIVGTQKTIFKLEKQ